MTETGLSRQVGKAMSIYFQGYSIYLINYKTDYTCKVILSTIVECWSNLTHVACVWKLKCWVAMLIPNRVSKGISVGLKEKE